MPDAIYHHGVKGQKWGARRYQYADGTRTQLGKRRMKAESSGSYLRKKSFEVVEGAKEKADQIKMKATGRQHQDSYLDKGTALSRIQTKDEFENLPFYATYDEDDKQKYLGLFGNNLLKRANAEAKAAGSEEAREKARNTNVYQLSIEAQKKLKIPSDENASHITADLLKESQFKSDVIASIQDSKDKMKRPAQQMLFNQALTSLKKDPEFMTSSEKEAVYKAFNLSLVNHNPREISAQNRFYSELSKKGYSALLDYNDKDYSSYHANRPVIVFDTSSVSLQSIRETNPKVVNSLYRKYNAERLRKETTAETIGLIKQASSMTVTQCEAAVRERESTNT